MDTQKLVGMRVMNTNTHAIGTIEYIHDGIAAVNYHGVISEYSYPSVFLDCWSLKMRNYRKKFRLQE